MDNMDNKQKFTCSHCGAEFGSEEELEDHMKNEHASMKEEIKQMA